ncbi:MAG: AIR synthase-related protein, partial [Pyrinomonadaceae bacterium]
FASPEKPEVMWSFSEVIDGMAEACRVLETPVVSGNVSFYNETEGRGILPTPVIGMIGLIEDVRRIVQPGFKNEGDLIALLGTTADDLSMSEYAVTVGKLTTDEIVAAGVTPRLDLHRECAVQRTCLEAAEAGLLQSAHDCSDGGLAVTLAESCFSSLVREAKGADLSIKSPLETPTVLFSESPSRIVVSFNPSDASAVEKIAERHSSPFTLLGRVGGTNLRIEVNSEPVIETPVTRLEDEWRNALGKKLQAEAMVAGRE